jgi:hypothetical protein
MPNLTGFTPLPENPEWVTLQLDDGTSSHPIHDPTGEYRAEVKTIAQKLMGTPPSPTAGAVAQNAPPAGEAPLLSVGTPVSPGGAPVATDAFVPPPQPPATPIFTPPAPSDLGGVQVVGGAARPGLPLAEVVPAAPHAPGPVTGDAKQAIGGALAGQGAPEFAPPPVRSLVHPTPVAGATPVSDERGGGGGGGDPYAPRYMQQGGTGPGVAVTEQTTTQGLTKADRAKVDAANEAAVQKAEQADKEELLARSHAFLSEWQRLDEVTKKQLVEKSALDEQEKFYNQRLENQYAKLDADAARKIDPSEAFAGDAGAYAFMAGFGDALQNFGAALSGRGAVADPAARIEGIINRSVRLQTEQKQADLEAGKISANRLEADREHVRFKLATVGKQMADTELERAHTREEYMALGAMKKKMEAIQADARAKNAAATARAETNARTTQTTPGTAGGAVDYFLGEDQTKNGGWKAVEAHGARQAGGDQIETALGRFQRATGYTWDPQALNGAGAFKDANGKVVSADKADVPGVTSLGSNFKILSGEMGREVQGALGDLAAGRAKIADPVGAVSDKSIDAQREQMAAGTDEGAFRAMESAARQLKTMRGKVDSESSPGVVNASRLRRQEEKGFQASRPGLPSSRAATPEELRGKQRPDELPKGEMR